MQIDVLTVPDCPNLAEALTRIDAALVIVDNTDTAVRTHLVVDLAQAEALGMHGSPTIRIDGRDLFAVDDSSASISCRLYRSDAGMSGCPTVNEIVAAIEASAR